MVEKAGTYFVREGNAWKVLYENGTVGTLDDWIKEYSALVKKQYVDKKPIDLSTIDDFAFLTSKQKDLLKISARNGDVSKLIKYTFKDGEPIWLEEGLTRVSPEDDFGWIHILDKHRWDSTIPDSTKFPEIPDEDILDMIFKIISEEKPTPSRENLKYVKEIIFPDGRKANVRVFTDKDGKILSAYPEKPFK